MKEIFNEIKLHFKTYWKIWIPIYGIYYFLKNRIKLHYKLSDFIFIINGFYQGCLTGLILGFIL